MNLVSKSSHAAHSNYYPAARTDSDGLLSLAVDDELIVYDLERHKASCLNQTAAQVWRMCDGETPISDLVDVIGDGNNMPRQEAESVVMLALDRLEKSHLLAGDSKPPASASLSRRELMRRLKMAGVAIALPVIYTVAAPDPAAAQSVPPVVCGQTCHPVQGIYCPQGCRCSKTSGLGVCLPA